MSESQPRNLRGTWPQALLTFFMPVLLVVGVRWLLFEPFVIPSGSMIPTLLIHDHILVNKLRFGVKIPFSNLFLAQWGHPHRGEIVVFRYPENPDVFFVKRVAAVAGDTLEVKEGNLVINGQKVESDPISHYEVLKNIRQEEGFDYFREHALDLKSEDTHVVRYKDKVFSSFPPFLLIFFVVHGMKWDIMARIPRKNIAKSIGI